LVLVLGGAGRLFAPSEAEHGHTEHAVADHAHEVHHQQHDDHEHEHDPEAATDPLSRLEIAVEQTRAGELRGLQELARLTQIDAAFIRMEAHDRLSTVAGEDAVTYEPLAGPDVAGLWASWAASPPEGWPLRAVDLPLP
jgi:hypothetical protein